MRLSAFVYGAFVLFGITDAKPMDDEVASKVPENATQLLNPERIDENTSDTTEIAADINETVAVVLVNRTSHARMMMSPLEDLFPRRTTTTTTSTVAPITEYDYWWYFTTPRRPRFSYRDFPGKPGVATWKEISPSAAKEGKKDSNLVAEPTAAEMYNGAYGGQSEAVVLLAAAILLLCNSYFTLLGL